METEQATYATLASFIDQLSSTSHVPVGQKMGPNGQSSSYNMSNYASFGRTQPQSNFAFESFAQKITRNANQTKPAEFTNSYFTTYTTPKVPQNNTPNIPQNSFTPFSPPPPT